MQISVIELLQSDQRVCERAAVLFPVEKKYVLVLEFLLTRRLHVRGLNLRVIFDRYQEKEKLNFTDEREEIFLYKLIVVRSFTRFSVVIS